MAALTPVGAVVPESASSASRIPAMQVAATPVPAMQVVDARIGVHGSITRFVLDLSRPASFRLFTLADPYRVVIDLPQAVWSPRSSLANSRTGLVGRVRHGQFKPGTTRVVLDCNGPVAVNEAFLMAPINGRGHRLVVDLVATSPQRFLAAHGEGRAARVVDAVPVKASPPAPAAASPAVPMVVASGAGSSPRFAPPPLKPRQRVVVIDSGHGGVDPGAIGVSGTYEKHVTLAMARGLRDHLRRTGRYKVLLTRERDVFIRLRDRIAFARAAGAELFISLHADAMKKRTVRGASVYTLSERASDAEAAALAERENKVDLIAGVDLSDESPEVTNILIDLAQRETMNESAKVASLLVSQLRQETRMLPNSHRFAGFAVLKAPDIPSVLVEAGFLSNRTDERRLKDAAHRRRLISAIGRAIDAYFVRVEEARRN